MGLMLWVMVASGCVAGKHIEIIEARDVSRAWGTPRIDTIQDLGTSQTLQYGRLNPASANGYGVIGELLLLRGKNFGKQPRVTIGGRGAAVLAHTNGDGVVVRIPWGIDPGKVMVEVVHGQGRHTMVYPIKRRGLYCTGQSAHLVEVREDGQVLPGPQIPLPGARLLGYSFDGSAAYVITERQKALKMHVLDMTGARPRQVTENKLPGSRVIDLATSSQAPMGAVVTDTHVVLFDSHNALIPSLYAPHKIPWDVQQKQVLAAALGGQGKVLGLLVADLNEVMLLDISTPKKVGGFSSVKILPEGRLRLVKDLKLSDDGGSLWVVSGDNPRSREGGQQPALLSQFQVAPAEPSGMKATLVRRWELGEGIAPMELVTARGEPRPPGTSIRREPSKSAVYLSVNPSALLHDGVKKFFQAGEPSRLIRGGLTSEPVNVYSGPWALYSQDVVGKSQVAVALGWTRTSKGKLQRVITGGKAWESGKPSVVLVGKPRPLGDEKSLPWPGEFRAQP